MNSLVLLFIYIHTVFGSPRWKKNTLDTISIEKEEEEKKITHEKQFEEVLHSRGFAEQMKYICIYLSKWNDTLIRFIWREHEKPEPVKDTNSHSYSSVQNK